MSKLQALSGRTLFIGCAMIGIPSRGTVTDPPTVATLAKECWNHTLVYAARGFHDALFGS